jgi:toxin YoeB
MELLAACLRDPFAGIGKPEPLQHDFAGCWSRRIDREHRMIYRVEGERLIVLQCRYHYG